MAVVALAENGGGGKKVKTLGQIARDVGYSEMVALSPSAKVFDRPPVKIALAAICGGLDSVANKITQALDKVDYSTREPEKNAYVLDKVVKNRQLLSGGATENTELVIRWE